MAEARITSVNEYHDFLTNRMFNSIIVNPKNKLKQLIPEANDQMRFDLRKNLLLSKGLNLIVFLILL